MRVLWLTGLVIAIDQATKLLVMKTMYLGQQIALLGDWLKLTYTENPGMAFGITFGPRGMVTVFSVIATFLITLYLLKVRKGYLPYRASLAFILGGAVGNIIDRVFYGAVFGGDSLFVGRVVDFIHVNVWSGFIPESLPLIGGTYLSLFPIWNVADMAIVCGVVGILYFQKRFHFAEYYGSDEMGEPTTVVSEPLEADLVTSSRLDAPEADSFGYEGAPFSASSSNNETHRSPEKDAQQGRDETQGEPASSKKLGGSSASTRAAPGSRKDPDAAV